MLDRVLAAAHPVCDQLVVVGPPRPTDAAAVFVVEPEPGGGPAPAVRAGLAAVGQDHSQLLLVLAADLALLTTGALEQLLWSLVDDPALGAAAAADHRARPNPLLAAYRAGALWRTAGASQPGDPAAGILPPATLVVDVGWRAAFNVNTPDDLDRARELVGDDGDG